MAQRRLRLVRPKPAPPEGPAAPALEATVQAGAAAPAGDLVGALAALILERARRKVAERRRQANEKESGPEADPRGRESERPPDAAG